MQKLHPFVLVNGSLFCTSVNLNKIFLIEQFLRVLMRPHSVIPGSVDQLEDERPPGDDASASRQNTSSNKAFNHRAAIFSGQIISNISLSYCYVYLLPELWDPTMTIWGSCMASAPTVLKTSCSLLITGIRDSITPEVCAAF